MKSCTKYIDEAIKKELIKLLKEADVTVNPIKDAEDQVKNTEDQIEILKNDNKKFKNWQALATADIKGFQQQAKTLTVPVQRNAANLQLTQIAKPKEKDLKTMILSKEEQLKNLEDRLKSDEVRLKLAHQGVDVTAPPTAPSARAVSESKNKTSFPMIKRAFVTEQNEEPDSEFPPIENSNKAYVVKFDTNTQAPFDVKFTKRGFSIDGTRLGFETIENALSKNYTITLGGGKGFILNPIRMQQILKYKDKWF